MRVILLILLLLPGTLRANELLPVGTEIQLPGDDYILLNEPHFLLTRPEIDKILVQAADLERCQQNLVSCQNQLRQDPNPKPGFWKTTTGRTVIVGGFAVSVTGAFLGGFYLARK